MKDRDPCKLGDIATAKKWLDRMPTIEEQRALKMAAHRMQSHVLLGLPPRMDHEEIERRAIARWRKLIAIIDTVNKKYAVDLRDIIR